MFNKNGDFPFYNNKPFKLSLGKWIIWVVATIGAYFIFSGVGLKFFYKDLVIHKTPTELSLLLLGVMVVTFVLIFGSFWFVSKGHLNTLFKKVNKSMVLHSILVGIIGLVVVGVYNYFLIEQTLHIKTYSDIAVQDINVFHFFQIVVQLIAEEMWTIVPFLFVLFVMNKISKENRKLSIIVAWIVSSIIFALYHITSYNNDVLQVLLLIMPSRLILTYSYLKYKNVWASYITHLSYDMPILLIALITQLTK